MTENERQGEFRVVELNSAISRDKEVHTLRRQAAVAINSPAGFGPGDAIELVSISRINGNPFLFKAIEKGRKRLLDETGLEPLLYAGRRTISLLPGTGVAFRTPSEKEINEFYDDLKVNWTRYITGGGRKLGFDNYAVAFGVRGDIDGRLGARLSSSEQSYASYIKLLCIAVKGSHAPYLFFDLKETANNSFSITARCGNATLNVERGTALKRETVNYSNITEKTGGIELRAGDNVWLTEIPRAGFSVLPARIDGLPATFIMAR